MLDGLLSSLVEYLQLDNAYNIFILNPKRDERKSKYGYRCVFIECYHLLFIIYQIQQCHLFCRESRNYTQSKLMSL